MVTKQTQLLSWKVVTDINLVTAMPDEDKTLRAHTLVLNFKSISRFHIFQ